jgi:iron complex transport system substrate-binding protein
MKRIISILILIFVLPVYAEETPQRIITIGGALTEIVYQLDSGDRLVGNDTTSYYPSEAESLPKVGYQRALSVEGILSLKPDLVIHTNEAGPKTVLAQLKAAKVNLIEIKSGRSVEDIMENINIIAEAIGKKEKASEVIASLQQKKKSLDEAVSKKTNKQKVIFILQHGGGAPMVAGTKTAADSIIKLSGAENVVTSYEGYKPLTPEAVITNKPDIILITEQGLQQAGGKNSLLKNNALALTPAGKNGNIIAMDSLLLLGFGPRTLDAANTLNQKFNNL